MALDTFRGAGTLRLALEATQSHAHSATRRLYKLK